MTAKLPAALSFAAALLCLGARAAEAAPTATCYVNDGYLVSAAPDESGDNQIFSVKRKADADEALPCPLQDTPDLVFGEGGYGTGFQDLVGDHLVLVVSPDAVGNVVVVELRDGKVVLDVSGTYGSSDGTTLRYWQRGADGTAETCPIYDQLTANGLAVGLLDEMELDLETGVSTPTGATDCEGLS